MKYNILEISGILLYIFIGTVMIFLITMFVVEKRNDYRKKKNLYCPYCNSYLKKIAHPVLGKVVPNFCSWCGRSLEQKKEEEVEV